MRQAAPSQGQVLDSTNVNSIVGYMDSENSESSDDFFLSVKPSPTRFAQVSGNDGKKGTKGDGSANPTGAGGGGSNANSGSQNDRQAGKADGPVVKIPDVTGGPTQNRSATSQKNQTRKGAEEKSKEKTLEEKLQDKETVKNKPWLNDKQAPVVSAMDPGALGSSSAGVDPSAMLKEGKSKPQDVKVEVQKRDDKPTPWQREVRVTASFTPAQRAARAKAATNRDTRAALVRQRLQQERERRLRQQMKQEELRETRQRQAEAKARNDDLLRLLADDGLADPPAASPKSTPVSRFEADRRAFQRRATLDRRLRNARAAQEREFARLKFLEQKLKIEREQQAAERDQEEYLLRWRAQYPELVAAEAARFRKPGEDTKMFVVDERGKLVKPPAKNAKTGTAPNNPPRFADASVGDGDGVGSAVERSLERLENLQRMPAFGT